MQRIRPHRAAVLVVVVGVALASVTFAASRHVTEQDERQIFEREARLTATAMQSMVGSAESSLESAAAIAAVTGGGSEAFRGYAQSSGLDFYSAVVLLRDHGTNWSPESVVGEPAAPLDDTVSKMVSALDPGAFSLLGYRGEGFGRTLALAARSESAPDLTAYAEFPMPAGIGIGNGEAAMQTETGFDLDFALYVESESTENIAFSSTRELPLTGTRAVVTFALDDEESESYAAVELGTKPGTARGGSDELVLVTAPKGPLTGWLAERMPWLLLASMLVGTFGVGAVIELAVRRRDRALELVEEVEAAEATVIAQQERFREIISGSPDVMISTDRRQGRMEMLNRDSFFGYAADEFLSVEDFRRVFHPDDFDAVMAMGAQLREAGDDVVELECRLRPKGRDWEWVRLRVKALERDSDGDPVQTLTTCTIVTTEKEAEADRDRLEAQLRQSQRLEAIGQLAGGIAHDFNNLLAVILSYAGFAAEEMADHPAASDIDEVIGAARRAADLTSQLLTFSRRQIVEPELIDVNEVITAMERILERTLGENVRLVTGLSDDIGAVYTDAGEIEQILMNLAVNARDALRGADGVLSIETMPVHLEEIDSSLYPEAGPGSYLRLSVSDSGSGMATEVAARAFEPFFTTKEPGAGTGMGLATVYGIAQRWGGWAAIYSEPGQGTVVRVYLPMSEEPATRAPRPEARERDVHDAKVLVVEDESGVRAAARRILEGAGYRIVDAASGAAALDHPEAGTVDVLLTDVVMPGGVSGRDLAEELVSRNPALKVVYMSGYTRDVIAHQGVLEEGLHLVEKPFTAEGLVAAVDEALHDNTVETVR